MTVEAIKDAIAGLPKDGRQSLVAWLNGLDYDAWDKEMLKDFSPGGRGMAWVEKVKRQIAEGKACFQTVRDLRREPASSIPSIETRG